MKINPENRAAAAKVYTDYRQPFLDTIEGALTKELLIRNEDVQVIHVSIAWNTQRHILKQICLAMMSLKDSSQLGQANPTFVFMK